MPGQIDNTTILTAINQVVAALNELTTGLTEMNITINNSGGGCGCCGGGASLNDNGFIDPGDTAPDFGYGQPGDTASDASPGTYPETFASYLQYQEYRCRVAGNIVDVAIDFASNMFTHSALIALVTAATGAGGISMATATAGTIMGYGAAAATYGTLGISLSSIVIVAMPIILAAAALILALNAGALSGLASELTNQKDSIACGMLNSRTSSQARQSLLSDIETILTDNSIPLDGMINSVFALFLPERLFTPLFFDDRERMGALSEYECPAVCDGDNGLWDFAAMGNTGLWQIAQATQEYSFVDGMGPQAAYNANSSTAVLIIDKLNRTYDVTNIRVKTFGDDFIARLVQIFFSPDGETWTLAAENSNVTPTTACGDWVEFTGLSGADVYIRVAAHQFQNVTYVGICAVEIYDV